MASPESTVPYGYCHCGCGGRTRLSRQDHPKLGWVKGEPFRYIAGHQRRKSPVEYLVDESTGCWVWQRGENGQGYGYIGAKDRKGLAHRIYYEQAKGPIPDGLVIDHRCENRLCVNPDHLQAVPQSHNSRAGGRTKLRADQVRDIKSRRLLAREYAAKHDIGIHTVYGIWRGRTWADFT